MKRTLQLVVGLAVSGLLLWLVFREVAVADVIDAMRGAHPAWLAAIVGASILSLWARGQRWRLLFAHLGAVPVSRLFASQAVGFAANTVLPFRAGEPVKALSISRKQGFGFTTAFATIVLERVFDMVAVGALLAAALVLVPIPAAASPTVTAAVRLLAGVAIAVTLGILTLMFLRDRMLTWIDAILERVPPRLADPVRSTVHSFVSGLHALADVRQLITVLASSAWVWAVLAAPYALAARALSLDDTYGFALVPFAVVTTALVAIFVMIPAAPGFLGTFQAGCVVALGIFGVPREVALGYSLLVHALTFLPATALGLVLLAHEGLSLRRPPRAGASSGTT